MIQSVHIFAGFFETREDASAYTEAHWEPEPTEGVCDQEYAAWESRNPIWPLRSDLGVYLDSDFIEMIDAVDRYEYLGEMLTDPNAVERIRSDAGDKANTLLLIFAAALGNFPATMKSTAKLTYCGNFSCEL